MDDRKGHGVTQDDKGWPPGAERLAQKVPRIVFCSLRGVFGKGCVSTFATYINLFPKKKSVLKGRGLGWMG